MRVCVYIVTTARIQFPQVMLRIPATTACCLALTYTLLGTGCGTTGTDSGEGWSGTIDTLASGEIVVRNTDEPLWTEEQTWQVVEEMRIGSDTGETAFVFGRIRSFDVNAQGQVVALDAQSQEIHMFDSDGTHIRTVGGMGTGPGEFERASAVDLARNGDIWVMQMRRGQLTVLDANGDYVTTKSIGSTGWTRSPYPGGFDQFGRYNALIRTSHDEGESEAFARFDQSLAPLDTIPFPDKPDSEFWQNESGTMRVGVPYQGHIDWCFAPNGNLWTLTTDRYELAEVNSSGQAIRRITKEFEPIPVTAEEREQLRHSMKWFTDQGGKIDWSMLPNARPSVSSLFCDDEANLWVGRAATQTNDSAQDEGPLYDLFDPEGRYLGVLTFPFDLHSDPIVRNGVLYVQSRDEIGANIIVRGRINKPQG